MRAAYCVVQTLDLASRDLRIAGSWLAYVRDPKRAGSSTQPFDGLSGKWTGEGSIALTNGTVERLRCDASYTVSGGGDNLDQTLRCASDSYKFDLRVSLADKRDAILGNWNQQSNNVQGGISDQDSKGLIQLTVTGQTFSASVTVATRESQRSVKFVHRAESYRK